jgi:hypothetical protein
MVTNAEAAKYDERKREWIEQLRQESESEEYDQRQQAWLKSLSDAIKNSKAEPASDKDVYDVINKINSWNAKQWSTAYKQGYAKWAKDLLAEEKTNKQSCEQIADWSSKAKGAK